MCSLLGCKLIAATTLFGYSPWYLVLRDEREAAFLQWGFRYDYGKCSLLWPVLLIT